MDLMPNNRKYFILLHNLANAIDPLQVKEKEEKSSSINKNIQNISVTWKDGKKDESRKIVYIPQTSLNRLSDAKESTTEIDRIIQDIVWIDAEAKSTYTSMLQSIKDYKSTLNMSILGLIENHKEINSLREDKKEIGDQEGIEAQIEKLSSRKEINQVKTPKRNKLISVLHLGVGIISLFQGDPTYPQKGKM